MHMNILDLQVKDKWIFVNKAKRNKPPSHLRLHQLGYSRNSLNYGDKPEVQIELPLETIRHEDPINWCFGSWQGE